MKYIYIYISTQAWRLFSIQSLRFIHTVGALHELSKSLLDQESVSVNTTEKSKSEQLSSNKDSLPTLPTFDHRSSFTGRREKTSLLMEFLLEKELWP